jgi:hypothetical protein
LNLNSGYMITVEIDLDLISFYASQRGTSIGPSPISSASLLMS